MVYVRRKEDSVVLLLAVKSTNKTDLQQWKAPRCELMTRRVCQTFIHLSLSLDKHKCGGACAAAANCATAARRVGEKSETATGAALWPPACGALERARRPPTAPTRKKMRCEQLGTWVSARRAGYRAAAAAAASARCSGAPIDRRALTSAQCTAPPTRGAPAVRARACRARARACQPLAPLSQRARHLTRRRMARRKSRQQFGNAPRQRSALTRR